MSLDAARKTYHMEVGLLSYEHNYEELVSAAQAYIQALEDALAAQAERTRTVEAALMPFVEVWQAWEAYLETYDAAEEGAPDFWDWRFGQADHTQNYERAAEALKDADHD